MRSERLPRVFRSLRMWRWATKKGSPQGALLATEAAGETRWCQPAVLLAPIFGAVFTLQTMVTARMPITTPSDTITGIL